jgi:hypothetical protein
MSLLQVRKHFIEISGRYDLITDDVSYADKGADKYIVLGQQWLDTTFEFAKISGSWFTTAAIGSWFALVPQCRNIREVWMSTNTAGKWKLEKRTLKEFRMENANDPANIDRGPGLIYTIKDLRTPAEVVGTTIIDKFGTSTYSSAVDNFTYLGVLWLPPLAVSTTLEIRGDFYQDKPTVDASVNYWTEIQPMVLAMSACRVLEMSYRNIAGVNDWERSIRGQLLGFELDLAALESAEITEMEG